MKRISNEEILTATKKIKILKLCDVLKDIKYSFKKIYCLSFICLLFILIVNDIILITLLRKKPDLISQKIQILYNKSNIEKSNIDLNDEFFMIKTVKEQINTKNLTFINTISGGYGHVGNALIMLNNLINICEKIMCHNIISPGGLQSIIKKPIFYPEYNITIFPNRYRENISIDIMLTKHDAFWFNYRKKPHLNRLKIIREEVLNNIPKYIANPNDLYINIRSGDIFSTRINHMYSQPPLCFYQKIINENNYSDIYILSNGHENPIVDKLLEIYPKIKYIHGKIEYDISVIINAYNFVMPVSTFPETLINLNSNLKNLYIYDLLRSSPQKVNYTIYKMIPSLKYSEIMEKKWKKSKEQLDLMMNENCINNTMEVFHPNPL